GDERRPQSFEKARCDELVPAERNFTWSVRVVPREDWIAPFVTIHGDTHGEADGGDTRNGLDLMQNLLLDAGHALGVFHLRVGNVDAECLEFRRRDESGV